MGSVKAIKEERWCETEQSYCLIQIHWDCWGLGHRAWRNWRLASPER